MVQESRKKPDKRTHCRTGHYQGKEEYVLNYFNNRSTNAAAESLNSKMKGFRAQVRGVSDLPFFMYRMMKIFG